MKIALKQAYKLLPIPFVAVVFWFAIANFASADYIYYYYAGTPTPTPYVQSDLVRPYVSTDFVVNNGNGTYQLSGRVNPNGHYINARFEYGTSPSFGWVTKETAIGSGFAYITVTETINANELRDHSDYYFRLAVRTESGSYTYGPILNFFNVGQSQTTSIPAYNSGTARSTTTSNAPANNSANNAGGINFFSYFTGNNSSTTAVDSKYFNYPGTGVGGTSNKGTIGVNNSSNGDDNVNLYTEGKNVDIGKEFDYSVAYSTYNDRAVNNAELKVILPPEAQLINATPKPDKIEGNMVIFNLGNIKRNENGSVFVRVRILDTAQPNTNAVFASIFEYRDSNGASKTVSSYSNNLALGSPNQTNTGGNLIADLGGYFSVIWLVAFALVVSALFFMFRYRSNRKTVSYVFERNDGINIGKQSPVQETPQKSIGTTAPKIESQQFPGMNLPGFKVSK